MRRRWESGETPRLLEGGKAACAQCWIWQTWLQVRDAGDFPLVHELPSSGACLALSNCLPAGFRSPADLFLAAIVADFLPHPGAQLQILQNRAHASRLPDSVFMPLWPQPGLIPRDASRADRFERLGFYGDPGNLAAELSDPQWQSRLRESAGMELVVRRAESWHDYSDMDAVVGIRDFSGRAHIEKPATKLYNAWMAGVPFVGGADSAFAAERRGPLDYLEARSPDELIQLLARLRENPALRRNMVANGLERAVEFRPAAIRERWLELLSKEVPQRAARWKRRPAGAKLVNGWRWRLVFSIDRLMRR